MLSRQLAVTLARCCRRVRCQSSSAAAASDEAPSQLSSDDERFARELCQPRRLPEQSEAERAVDLLTSLWRTPGRAPPAKNYAALHQLLRGVLAFPQWHVPRLPSGNFLKIEADAPALPAFTSAERLDGFLAGGWSPGAKLMSGAEVVALLWGDAFLRSDTARLNESLVWNPDRRRASVFFPGKEMGLHLWDFAMAMPTESAVASGPDAMLADRVALVSYPYYLLTAQKQFDLAPDAPRQLRLYTAMDLALRGRAELAAAAGIAEQSVVVHRISLPNVDATLSSEENAASPERLTGVRIVYAHGEDPANPLARDLSANQLRDLLQAFDDVHLERSAAV